VKGGITLETNYMGLHETHEIHELLMFKNLCLTKSTTMGALVQDQELKNILQSDVSATQQQVQRLQEFITNRGGQQQ
jgi:similar to spore coat protein